MNQAWLWDLKISFEEAQQILKNGENERFIEIAALLLSRNNEPNEVFVEYLDRGIFLHYWAQIKKRMRQNAWNDPRIIFWQAVYESVKKNREKWGIAAPVRRKKSRNEASAAIGNQISAVRKDSGLTQRELADRIHVSQQIISRVERGAGDVRLSTINKIYEALGHKMSIVSSSKS